jgi:pseudouridine synthase
MPKEYRINKYIAEALGCSRRKAEQYVNDGQVKVNKKVVDDLSTRVTEKDTVMVSGKPLKLKMHEYIIFNKPAGYITSRNDEKGRKTVYDLLPDKFRLLKPVGRLDKDSSGLLLLTNDGELMNVLSHPKYNVPKKYSVVVKGAFTFNDAKIFSEGVDIGENQPAKAEVLDMSKMKPGYVRVLLELRQGYNRQIRRMIERMGYKVNSLKRISLGCLNMKSLDRGDYSILSKKEIIHLKTYVAKIKKESMETE